MKKRVLIISLSVSVILCIGFMIFFIMKEKKYPLDSFTFSEEEYKNSTFNSGEHELIKIYDWMEFETEDGFLVHQLMKDKKVDESHLHSASYTVYDLKDQTYCAKLVQTDGEVKAQAFYSFPSSATDTLKSFEYFGKNGKTILKQNGIRAKIQAVYCFQNLYSYEWVYYKTTAGDFVFLISVDRYDNNYVKGLYLLPLEDYEKYCEGVIQYGQDLPDNYMGSQQVEDTYFDLSPYSIEITDEIISQCGFVTDETNEINWREIQ